MGGAGHVNLEFWSFMLYAVNKGIKMPLVTAVCWISMCVYATGFLTASKSTVDAADFHSTVVDYTGVHGQVYACWPQWSAGT